ncbi:MAG: nucleotidyltransferase [Planctomycetes bacterium]|nr:nucleotidyltransferase [Planctomycetota bacterium]
MLAHLDADCFYVSAERVRHPHLRGMPIGVLGNHGACIIAKSYEMKAAGVSTGMPIWEARPICPQGVYVKRDFQWYEMLSRKMLGIVQEWSPCIEFYSIDEFFFTTQDTTLAAAEHWQSDMQRRVGVPVSIGIAPTKTLAKLISDSSKPFGCGVLHDEAGRRQLLRAKPVTEITGIAARSAAKLAAQGITTCEQFADADRAFIRWLLTKRGEDLWWELNGTPVQPVLSKRPDHKFISRGGSIGSASADPARVQAFVVRNTERLVEALNYYKVMCDFLTLSLLFTDRPEQGERVHLLGSTADYEEILQAALWLLPRVWQPATSQVHYMHVIAGGLRRQRQLSLFGEPSSRAARVAETKRHINQKLGRFAVRSALTLPLADVHLDPANDYDICDIYGKSCF